MKLLKILGIAAAVHVLALLVILANPGCSNSKAQTNDSPISSAPAAGANGPGPVVSAPPAPAPDGSVGIRYSPTRPGTAVASALTEAPVTDVTPATAYTVVRGDSLYTIAKKHGLTKAALAAANNLKPNAALHAGQKLIIPAKGATPAPAPLGGGPEAPTAASPIASAPPEKVPMTEKTTYTVKAGDTLGSIARRNGVKQGDLAVANNITDPKRIQPGQELVIPAHPLNARGARPGNAATGAGAAPAKAPTIAPADQDLDAGLKPGTDVPVVKIDDGSAPPKNP